MKKFLSAAVVALFFQTTLTAQAAPESEKASEDLLAVSAENGDDVERDVIVQYVTPPQDLDLRRVRRSGGRLTRIQEDGRSAHFRMSARAARELAQDENVAYVSPDREVRASGIIDYSMVTVGAIKAQANGYDGRNIGVALIDSGVASGSYDLQNAACSATRVVYSENFAVWDPDSWDPYGHGTHVAGIVGGNGICSAKFAGTGYVGFPVLRRR